MGARRRSVGVHADVVTHFVAVDADAPMTLILRRATTQTIVHKPDTPPDWVDPEDAPELTDEWFEDADLKVNGKLVRRGRPPGSNKQQVAIRLDKDII